MTLFHQPLFNQRLLAQRAASQPTPADHKRLLLDWAATIRNGSIRKQKESELRGPFIQRVFVELLGYRPFGSGLEWTLNDEKRTGSGSADTVLGLFSSTGKKVIAPVELKGADTPDLDAIMPGRHKSPVQQVWEYAMDTPGCKFLLVSNMVEIRLYAIGYTRQVYERFEILELADSDAAYQRFRLLLAADRLLSGETATLLRESALAEKEITQKLYRDYKTWRINLLIALMQSTEKSAEELIEPVQKLLDRVLFVAFAEHRGLLPSKSLSQAWSHRDPYHPRPVWDNFQALFRAIDKGNPALSIPAYNGGLFAADPVLDALAVPDDACRMFAELGGYDFAEDVSVTVLGHIFEQSVSDIEQLKELAGTEGFTLGALEAQVRESATSISGKRKQDGIVYTPDPITRFIVDQSLGTFLAEQQGRLRARFATNDGSWRKPTEDEKKLAGRKKQVKLKSQERLVEFLFWNAWRDRLHTLRVVDPACGSGAFLVAAFDLLDAEYRRVNEQIQAITGNPDFFDINREILNSNLYGVDLNPESIEISKLSLWLKTAQHGKPLESLEANLRIGNSLIADGKFTTRPFDWHAVFPDVFADGGFDVVLGNPPYVRMERLKPVKPYLEQHYAVASDRADLYCYFYELGLSLLKPGGRLGYISSSTFFKTGSGAALRRHLLTHAQVRTLVDFGDIQVFEGVTTYPAIVVVDRADSPDPQAPIRFLALGQAMPESLAAEFRQHAGTMPQGQLGNDAWRLESDVLARLREKLIQGHPTLKEVYGSPLYGIKTGLERAFVVDRATRDRLIGEDPRSKELLKPYLEGKDLKTWHVDTQDLWLIYIPKRRIAIADFPAIERHLRPFKTALENRATNQEWFELQQSQERYSTAFSKEKIVFPDITDHSSFSLNNGSFLATTCFCIEVSKPWVLALLNSRAVWWLIQQVTPFVRGGFHRLKTQYIELLPIPKADAATHSRLGTLAESAQRAAEARRDLQQKFRFRVLTDLAPGGHSAKLTNKLFDWPALDFKAFHDEIKKQFKQPIPLAERDDWQARFDADKARVAELTAEIARCEREIDAEVYRLFNLTADEIALIEGSSTLAANTIPCDDNAHEAQPDTATRPTPEPMARPPRGRGQPARRLSEEGAGVHAELDGAGKRASGSRPGAGAADSTQPLDATRELASAAGPLTYTEVSERLAAKAADCLDELLDAPPSSIAVTPEWIREIHQHIAGDLFPDWAGRWRATEVQVGTHLPPPPREIAVQMQNFCLDLEERLRHVGDAQSIAGLLAWVDWRFQWIHPFRDFNGRVGRILLVVLCYRFGLPPVDPAAHGEAAQAYFSALRAADDGNLLPLQEIWLDRLSG
ncbi:Eco57I restriction-modification methylase domain-containing protein [Sulfuritalea sp.]|uniref:Eco57I restriction-modification methylase domain-containing protein n=1 Tax=Sulfuritalea sp. TaxID=2480090 RepID=UPI00286DA949|nr:N-6 DNA methylase [Sulfuritalea sp.]